ncbi:MULTISPECIES: zinc transporter permease subunit ZevB [Rodentibacter]|uniref:zinc transporter permease subunit ZevB n=1 Tax=Rodentibacter TaxID=1960084 RepID=UPI0020883258|nr:putative nickel/cobalt efflux system [Rodentibacter sp. JRC1]
MIKKWGILLAAVLIAAVVFPYLFVKVVEWQRVFNQFISVNLHQIKAHSDTAGFTLIVVSFLYGVIHALGPGHGKFIIAGYLSTHQSQLKTSMLLTFLSSLMQGLVAITATTIVVVILRLSSHYFQLSQLWLERVAFLLLFILGMRWIYQGIRGWRKKNIVSHKLQIKSVQQFSLLKQSAVKNPRVFAPIKSTASCSCGHQHLPSDSQLRQANDWKAKSLVILSIGMRPCSGAIFVLFFAYMLDLYWWGVVATLAMALGTGLMLSAFALLVRYIRSHAIKLAQWYRSPTWVEKSDVMLKCIAGAIMVFFALSLLYGTTLSATGGVVLFR